MADGWYVREDRHGNVHKQCVVRYGQWGPKYDGSDILYYDGTVVNTNPILQIPGATFSVRDLTQQYNVGITNATDKGNLRLAYTYNDNKPNNITLRTRDITLT